MGARRRPRQTPTNGLVSAPGQPPCAREEPLNETVKRWWEWSVFPSWKAWIMYFFLSILFVQFFLTDPYHSLLQYNFDPDWKLTAFLKEEDPARAKQLLTEVQYPLTQLQNLRLRKLLHRGLLATNKPKPVHREVAQAIYTLLVFPDAFPEKEESLLFKCILEALATSSHPGFYSTAAVIGLDKIIRKIYKKLQAGGKKTSSESEFVSKAVKHMIRLVTAMSPLELPETPPSQKLTAAQVETCPEVLTADIVAPLLFDLELNLLGPKKVRTVVLALKHPVRSVRLHAMKWIIRHSVLENITLVIDDRQPAQIGRGDEFSSYEDETENDPWDRLFRFYKHQPSQGFNKRSLIRLHTQLMAEQHLSAQISTHVTTPPLLRDLQINEHLWKEWVIYDFNKDGLVTADEVFWVLVEVYNVRMNYGKWELTSDALLPLVEGFVVDAETGITIEQWPLFWQTLMSYAKKRL